MKFTETLSLEIAVHAEWAVIESAREKIALGTADEVDRTLVEAFDNKVAQLQADSKHREKMKEANEIAQLQKPV